LQKVEPGDAVAMSCPKCLTEGVGRQAKHVVKHVGKHCGSEDAFCCVIKKGSGPTKRMTPPAKQQR
jgi:hypothetical protein